MSEVEARPLLTRAQVEAFRVRLVGHRVSVAGTDDFDEMRDLVDTCIAAMSELAAVDAFAQEPDDTALGNGYLAAHADGKNALRRELRAVRGIETT